LLLQPPILFSFLVESKGANSLFVNTTQRLVKRGAKKSGKACENSIPDPATAIEQEEREAKKNWKNGRIP